MKSKAANVAVIFGVLLLVAGVAWYRSTGRDAGRSLVSTGNAPSSSGLPRVVDFGSDKCATCKEMLPILEELRREYAGRAAVEFVDVLENPSAGEPFDIRVLPTQIFFDPKGQVVWRHEGGLTKAQFVAKLAELGVQ